MPAGLSEIPANEDSAGLGRRPNEESQERGQSEAASLVGSVQSAAGLGPAANQRSSRPRPEANGRARGGRPGPAVRGAGTRARRRELHLLSRGARPAALVWPPRRAGLARAFPHAAKAAMAAAAEQEQQQFYLLLGNLLSPDNAVRKQAEVTGPRAGLSASPGPAAAAPRASGRRGREAVAAVITVTAVSSGARSRSNGSYPAGAGGGHSSGVSQATGSPGPGAAPLWGPALLPAPNKAA